MPQRAFVFYCVAFACFFPIIQSPTALILGFLLASVGLVPKHVDLAALSKRLLSYSIIGLGFGIQIDAAIYSVSSNIGLVIVSLMMTLILGACIGRWLNIDSRTSHLIASGTAICGGSAIAAVAPAINAKNEQISVALATVFILNAISLYAFPIIGHALSLDEVRFGTWAAIAIHDTSSVVGAAGAYGEQALQVATTTKLARALWIIPIALISSWIFKGDSRRFTFPAFIGWYIVALLISSYVPQFGTFYGVIFQIAKQMLVVSLFLVGASMTISQFKRAGIKPFILALTLWVLISVGSLAYLLI
ncbi:YeiH family protein [Thaumasiovibrio subtropicus]|uniref:YeiH family protein n=1 Tax=Thaumasiovibrio subtropicus TaxID=1891207 RepID=UPI000B35D424|nr:putative sulfate exporter family transporter [Thaumasiovibrio subtropicus]